MHHVAGQAVARQPLGSVRRWRHRCSARPHRAPPSAASGDACSLISAIRKASVMVRRPVGFVGEAKGQSACLGIESTETAVALDGGALRP